MQKEITIQEVEKFFALPTQDDGGESDMLKFAFLCSQRDRPAHLVAKLAFIDVHIEDEHVREAIKMLLGF